MRKRGAHIRHRAACAPGMLAQSIDMPRRASRITLEINAVRVERLKDITWSDAAKEGIHVPRRARDRVDPEIGCVAQFRMLWEQINGSGSWDTNPWVWVIDFKRVEGDEA
jgi:hypothetical protein